MKNSRTDFLLTTQARKRTRDKTHKQINIAAWNVRGYCNKEAELENELKSAKVDIAIISETKKKSRGSMELKDYILIYSGVDKNERAQAGVAIMIDKK